MPTARALLWVGFVVGSAERAQGQTGGVDIVCADNATYTDNQGSDCQNQTCLQNETDIEELRTNCPVACGVCPTAVPTADPSTSPSISPTTWDPTSSPTSSDPPTSSPTPAPTIAGALSTRGTASTADATPSWVANLVWGVLLLMVLPANVAFLIYSRRARKRREASRGAVAARASAMQSNRGFKPSMGADTVVSATALEAGLAEPSAAGPVTTGCGQPDYGTPVCQAIGAKPAHAEPSDCPSTNTLVGTNTVNHRDTACLAPTTHNPEYMYSTANRDTTYLVPVTDNPKDADSTANHRDTKYLVPVTHNPQYVDSQGGVGSPEYADVDDADLTSTDVDDADLASTNVDELRVEGVGKDGVPGLADRDRVDMVECRTTSLGYTVITGGHSRSSSIGTDLSIEQGAAAGTPPHLYEYCELRSVLSK